VKEMERKGENLVDEINYAITDAIDRRWGK
jgi:hypothetical protein